MIKFCCGGLQCNRVCTNCCRVVCGALGEREREVAQARQTAENCDLASVGIVVDSASNTTGFQEEKKKIIHLGGEWEHI